MQREPRILLHLFQKHRVCTSKKKNFPFGIQCIKITAFSFQLLSTPLHTVDFTLAVTRPTPPRHSLPRCVVRRYLPRRTVRPVRLGCATIGGSWSCVRACFTSEIVSESSVGSWCGGHAPQLASDGSHRRKRRWFELSASVPTRGNGAKKRWRAVRLCSVQGQKWLNRSL